MHYYGTNLTRTVFPSFGKTNKTRKLLPKCKERYYEIPFF